MCVTIDKVLILVSSIYIFTFNINPNYNCCCCKGNKYTSNRNIKKTIGPTYPHKKHIITALDDKKKNNELEEKQNGKIDDIEGILDILEDKSYNPENMNEFKKSSDEENKENEIEENNNLENSKIEENNNLEISKIEENNNLEISEIKEKLNKVEGNKIDDGEIKKVQYKIDKEKLEYKIDGKTVAKIEYKIDEKYNTKEEEKINDSLKKLNYIYATSDSISLNEKKLTKLENVEKQKCIVNDKYLQNNNKKNKFNNTNIYNTQTDAFNYEYMIEIQDIENIPYIIALVEVKDKSKETKFCYIISCLNYKPISNKGLFEKCESITKINILKSNNVENMSSMFCDCSSIEELILTNLDTSKTTDMSYMFLGCIQLKELDLSSWDTSKVTNMSYMFNSCKAIEKLNFSNFIFNNKTNILHILFGCISLKNENLIIKDKYTKEQLIN